MSAAHLALVDDAPAGTAPLVVQPLIEQERDGSVTHEVHVTLTDEQWRQILGDVCAAIASRVGRGILHRVLVAGHRPVSIEQQRALDDVVILLSGPTHPGSTYPLPPTFALTPDQAGYLAEAIFDAALDPVMCACGAVVQQPTQLTTTCGGCVDRKGGE